MHQTPTKGYIAYVRVSDKKQVAGASLSEQRRLIAEYARKHGLAVDQWVVEQKTAAVSGGRPGFAQVMRDLRAGRAKGLIVHKVDRSIRNLEEWGMIGRLADSGVDVRLVSDDLNLTTRAGRLSANIQAVLAEDYIRNLRDEVRKGIVGRLEEGIYPFAAPVGYLDTGKKSLKRIDPLKGPLVRRAFELYDRGDGGLVALTERLGQDGLTNHRGKTIALNAVNKMLRNPFYAGVIKIMRSGQTYPGKHEPLIPMSLFQRVQARMDGRLNRRTRTHDFLFRRTLRCRHCPFALIGELQKGRVYYRCHTRTCPTIGVREDYVDSVFRASLATLTFDAQERSYLKERAQAMRAKEEQSKSEQRVALRLKLDQLVARRDKVTDAWLDGDLDKAECAQRKEQLLKEEAVVRERLEGLEQQSDRSDVADVLELAGTASLLYEFANPEQKRSLVHVVASNLVVDGKNLEVALAPPFSLIAKRHEDARCTPQRDNSRILEALLSQLQRSVEEMPDKIASGEAVRGLLDIALQHDEGERHNASAAA